MKGFWTALAMIAPTVVACVAGTALWMNRDSSRMPVATSPSVPIIAPIGETPPNPAANAGSQASLGQTQAFSATRYVPAVPKTPIAQSEPRRLDKPKASRNYEAKTAEVAPFADATAMLTGFVSTVNTMAKNVEAQQKAAQAAAQAVAEQSRTYFKLLGKVVFDLRDEMKVSGTVGLEKAADKVDNLPVLQVDEELVAFGAEIAKGLRDMAEARRALARGMGPADLAAYEQVQSASIAVKTQGMQRINIGLANMRRKMTKKYSLEFMSTPTHTRAATYHASRTTHH